jgi:hypothetical protein
MTFVGPPPGHFALQFLFLNCGIVEAQLGTQIGTRLTYRNWDAVDFVAIGKPPTSQGEVWSFNWSGGYNSSLTAEWDKEPVVRTDYPPSSATFGLDPSTTTMDRTAGLASLRQHGLNVVEID